MTKPYATVIGDPIAQSKSPSIHRFWASHLGLEVDYRADHVPAARLSSYLARQRDDPFWRGCNVTVPHKQAVISYCDRLSPLARRVGAVNCVVHAGDGRLMGDNSDVVGFSAPLAATGYRGGKAVVLGAGGAARAIIAGLADMGCEEIVVVNRNRQRIDEIAREMNIALDATSWEDASSTLRHAAVLINATSLGMRGQPPLPILLDFLPQEAIVNDIVYAPLETALLAAARARGNRVIDGLDMLIGQADPAFELFFGCKPPRAHDTELRRMLAS